MKNVALLLLAVLALGCKECPECEDCPDTTARTGERPAACANIEDLPSPDSSTPQDRATWLYNNRENFCDLSKLYAKVLLDHELKTGTKFTRTNTTAVKQWSEIRNLLRGYSNYGAYIEVYLDGGTLQLRQVPKFSTDIKAFSAAFFNALERKFNGNPPELRFSIVRFEGAPQDAVLIETGSAPVSYFDYSQEPTKKDNGPDVFEKNPL